MNFRTFACATAAVFCLSSIPAAAQSTDKVQPADTAEVDPTSPEFVRCKRIDVTGSRARKQRVCKTNAEWDRVARAGAELGRDTVERSTSTFRAEGM